ncbi:MAG: hybrid sensor histidine kinase/response regulator, partial [Oscillibacter sp.]|nr:hybrid sensor histidine kinase/response regulator [Oscillibacter sp.]
MKAGGKAHIALPAALTACFLLLLLVSGFYFAQYLQAQIFEERTTQLNEITSQVRVNLGTALDSHWKYLNAAVNLLSAEEYASAEEVTERIAGLERLLELEGGSAALMLLDSRGNSYDAEGRHGVWRGIDQISGGAARQTFISGSYLDRGSSWTFVRKLDAPLEAAEDGTVFTHAVLLEDVYTMSQYYDSDAYGSRNETYILKSNGTRMHDDVSGEGSTIQAYNVLKVLEEMEQQACPDIRAALEETDTVSAGFRHGGREYYYCVTSLAEYDTLLLFLIPAEFVASGTVEMVGTVIRMLLFLVVILLVVLILAAAAISRQQSSARQFRQEQENLRRQEEMNRRLEETNAMLARSKETAEQAF